MKAQLVFAFPFDVSAAEVFQSVADHFGVGVPDVIRTPVPAHIKQAVENVAAQLNSIGADDPSNGTEMSAQVAFGHLINGAAGNVLGASAPLVPSTAAVETSTTAPVVPTGTSATLNAPVANVPTAPGAAVPTAPASGTNPAGVEFDSTGLAWDERIHSGNKTKSPKGEWRARKGVDKSLIKAVELELRAKYGSGNANAAASVTPTNAAASTGTGVVNTPNGAAPDRAAAIEYANAQAYRVAGKSPIDDATLGTLLSGQPHALTLTPQQNDWFAVFFAKRNAAFSEYMAGNVAAAAPVVPQSLTPTGSEAAAQPGVALTNDASQTVGAGTPAPATNAQPGEGLDAVGLPWDARINIPAKIKDTAGVWVQRHDVAPQVKLDVIAELRAVLAGNGVVASSQAGQVGGTTDAPLPTTAESARGDFPSLLKWIAANQVQGRITPQAGPNAARDLGFIGQDGSGQLILLRDQPTFWTYVVDMLQGQGAI